jgi:hypothetical protein
MVIGVQWKDIDVGVQWKVMAVGVQRKDKVV